VADRRRLAFIALTAVCVLVAGASVAAAIHSRQEHGAASTRAAKAARPALDRVLDTGRPFVVFRWLDRTHPENFGRMAVAPLDGDTAGQRVLAGPACERVTYRAGAAICLGKAGVTGFPVTMLDARLRPRHELRLAGVPSRTRISPDGRWAGVTAFLTGHSYAQAGQFSTGATILDLRTGDVVGNLEKDFTVTRDGRAVTASDRNFWGLTFAADGDTFYATMATGGQTWLIRGSISKRRAETIHANVECPSLSPDGKRIGYKKAVGHDPTVWRFHVLDLATGRETPLAETRPIDDQLEWLDDANLLYRDGETTWVVRADGTGKPHEWLAAADSPAVVRPAS
jgi:WD40-like Beta Propeller Repeat